MRLQGGTSRLNYIPHNVHSLLSHMSGNMASTARQLRQALHSGGLGNNASPLPRPPPEYWARAPDREIKVELQVWYMGSWAVRGSGVVRDVEGTVR